MFLTQVTLVTNTCFSEQINVTYTAEIKHLTIRIKKKRIKKN